MTRSAGTGLCVNDGSDADVAQPWSTSIAKMSVYFCILGIGMVTVVVIDVVMVTPNVPANRHFAAGEFWARLSGPKLDRRKVSG